MGTHSTHHWIEWRDEDVKAEPTGVLAKALAPERDSHERDTRAKAEITGGDRARISLSSHRPPCIPEGF